MKHPKTANPRNTRVQAGKPAPSNLWQAIEACALERGHAPSDTAKFVGLDPSHYYRIRKTPHQISRCRSAVLQRFALYVRWPVLDVYVGAAIIDAQDLWAVPRVADVLSDALIRVSRSRFASTLITPIDKATTDHRLLIARLFVAIEAKTIDEG